MSLKEEVLTPRELEVYKYLLQGLDYAIIADKMNIGKTTIYTHIRHLFDKKIATDRYELMARRIQELEKEVQELKRTKCITRV